MATETASRDPNYVTTLQGVDMTTGKLPTNVFVDEATHRLLTNTVISAGTASIGDVNLNPAARGGWKPYFANAITSLVTVSSAPGKFGGYMLINLNSAPVYLQFFDTTGAVSVGSVTPTFVIPIPANGTPANGLGANLELGNGVEITSGLKVAATTTPTGGGIVATGITGAIWYK